MYRRPTVKEFSPGNVTQGDLTLGSVRSTRLSPEQEVRVQSGGGPSVGLWRYLLGGEGVVLLNM